MSEDQIAYVLRETLRGLDYLHNHGKMHRDIKVRMSRSIVKEFVVFQGANILLTDDGNVKLGNVIRRSTSLVERGVLFCVSADFGVAASITATMCKRKSFIGTPYW